MRKFTFVMMSLMVALMVMTALAGKSSTKSSTQWSEAQRKAGYIYLEALKCKQDSDEAGYDQLVRYAHELDPDNEYFSYCVALSNALYGNSSDTAQITSYILAHPKKKEEAQMYAHLMQYYGKSDEAVGALRRSIALYPKDIALKYQLTDVYERSGRYREAINMYDDFIKTEQLSLDYVAPKIVALYAMLGDTAQILQTARRVYEDKPNSLEGNEFVFSTYIYLQQPDSALRYVQNMERISPNSPYVDLAYAQYYLAKGDSLNVDRSTYKALMNPDLDMETKTEETVSYVRNIVSERDSSLRAERLLKTLIENHPHEPDFHRLYSIYLCQVKGDYKGAEEEISYALDMNPTNADDWKMKMYYCVLAEDKEGSIESGKKAIEYNPDNVDLYSYIAGFHTQRKEYREALDIYEMALDSLVDRSNRDVYVSLLTGYGDALYLSGDSVKAFQKYEEALHLDPNKMLALNNYAYFLAKSGKRLDEAERMSVRTIQAEPENVTYMDTYAYVLFKKKDYRLAKFYIEQAISIAKAQEQDEATVMKDLYEHYGDILFMNGEFDQALEQWQLALAQAPDDQLLQKKIQHKAYFPD